MKPELIPSLVIALGVAAGLWFLVAELADAMAELTNAIHVVNGI